MAAKQLNRRSPVQIVPRSAKPRCQRIRRYCAFPGRLAARIGPRAGTEAYPRNTSALSGKTDVRQGPSQDHCLSIRALATPDHECNTHEYRS
jgi:hypothetical protein